MSYTLYTTRLLLHETNQYLCTIQEIEPNNKLWQTCQKIVTYLNILLLLMRKDNQHQSPQPDIQETRDVLTHITAILETIRSMVEANAVKDHPYCQPLEFVSIILWIWIILILTSL